MNELKVITEFKKVPFKKLEEDLKNMLEQFFDRRYVTEVHSSVYCRHFYIAHTKGGRLCIENDSTNIRLYISVSQRIMNNNVNFYVLLGETDTSKPVNASGVLFAAKELWQSPTDEIPTPVDISLSCEDRIVKDVMSS